MQKCVSETTGGSLSWSTETPNTNCTGKKKKKRNSSAMSQDIPASSGWPTPSCMDKSPETAGMVGHGEVG